MRIIGIVGKKQSGKDEVCRVIKEHTFIGKVTRIAFADSLKEEVAAMLHITVPYLESHKEQFRLILQGFGTDYRRWQNKKYWIEAWQRKVQEAARNGYDIIIAPDVRFINEAEMIKDMGGELWRIFRNKGIGIDKHESETELSAISFDKKIVNDKDLIHLENQVTKLL